MQGKRNQPEWNNSDALVFVSGTSDESASYQTSNAFQVCFFKLAK